MTVENNWKIRDIEAKDLPEAYTELTKPFPKEVIEKGRLWYGLETEGIRSQHIINRLNGVLGVNHWHYTYVTVDEQRGKQWSARCDIRMEIGNWKFFDTDNISRDNDTVIIPGNSRQSIFVPLAVRSTVGGCAHISREEAHKGAITNAIKKCASLFGVAHEVYEGISDLDFDTGDTSLVETEEPEQVNIVKDEEKSLNELPLDDNKDEFTALLTAINSVKDKDTYKIAQEMMDKIKDNLSEEQVSIAVGAFVSLAKKFGK